MCDYVGDIFANENRWTRAQFDQKARRFAPLCDGMSAVWAKTSRVMRCERENDSGDLWISQVARTKKTKAQIIIIENSQQLPGDVTLSNVNVVLFSGNDQGRRGFIPTGGAHSQ